MAGARRTAASFGRAGLSAAWREYRRASGAGMAGPGGCRDGGLPPAGSGEPPHRAAEAPCLPYTLRLSSALARSHRCSVARPKLWLTVRLARRRRALEAVERSSGLLVLQPQPVILGLSTSPVMAELGAGLVTPAPALPMLAVAGAAGGLVPAGGQAADLVDGQRDQRAGAIVQEDVAGTAWWCGVTVCAGGPPPLWRGHRLRARPAAAGRAAGGGTRRR